MQPHYNFEIPSIHDGTTLKCRIYNPAHLLQVSKSKSDRSSWARRGIVMAHPYASMGGSYDDHVVGVVVEEFLEMGYVVGTFNFRGAHPSKGHTSWTGRPELDDYISFAACFVHYLHNLLSPSLRSLSMSPETMTNPAGSHIHIILGGYSYGSLIVKYLPPLSTILMQFYSAQSSNTGSRQSEILLRAKEFAAQTNTDLIKKHQQMRTRKSGNQRGRRKSLPLITVGGSEGPPFDQRRSSETRRRSIDDIARTIRTSISSHLHRPVSRRSHDTPQQGSRHDSGMTSNITSTLTSITQTTPSRSSVPTLPTTPVLSSTPTLPTTPAFSGAPPLTNPPVMPIAHAHYLLISPLLPPLSTLVAPTLSYRFWNRHSAAHHVQAFLHHPTLAVFGDQDSFTSARRLRHWAEKIESGGFLGPDERFHFELVEGAGHFWREEGVEERLRAVLRDWAWEMWDRAAWGRRRMTEGE
ncbi:hypothetical protein GQ43DRAFT_444591 [Delitschia confertaspora ATCC 74209]|uniref:AB hydrolase-1 domain-containing protein n=1 Tax=Delitschia confertaspora ATCC 74209 TaxID=1513339 RepID=A0A9P4JCN7_9PLEO|nr:hypothetical protein GQ43DRAFT_444591 [Delitschia confertaspora ATCC 74209]